jgi:hypothetical protein
VIQKYFFTKTNVLIIISILIIIISPINAREKSWVEPDYGGQYFGFYKYYIDINPKEVKSSVLNIYLPDETCWKDSLVLTREFTPLKDKSQTEYQLNERDDKDIWESYKGLFENQADHSQRDKVQNTVLGLWRYEFIINNKSTGMRDGPRMILYWEKPEYNQSDNTFYWRIYLTDIPVNVRLKLKYEKEERFEDYESIGRQKISEYNKGHFQDIKFEPGSLPEGLLPDSKLSKKEKDKILEKCVLDVELLDE